MADVHRAYPLFKHRGIDALDRSDKVIEKVTMFAAVRTFAIRKVHGSAVPTRTPMAC